MDRLEFSRTFGLMRHSLVVLLAGLLCGLGLGFAINGEVGLSPIPLTWEYTMAAEPRAWRSAHVGAITNGLMGLILAIILPFMGQSAKAISRLCLYTILVMYGNLVFYVAALWAPNRGLSFTGTEAGPGNLAGVIAYIPAILAAGLLIAVVIYLIATIPRQRDL